MKRVLILFLAIALGAFYYQSKQVNIPELNLGINPWPGYALLHIADEKGFFKEEGLQVKVSEISSLSDVRRAFERGQLDLYTSTVVEVLEIEARRPGASKIVLFPDFSNGGDVIVTFNDEIKTLKDLEGKVLGYEQSSLGLYLVNRALASAGVNESKVKLYSTEQLYMRDAFEQGHIDAMVSYPPYSVEILKNGGHTIFTTAEIPHEVLDTVSVRASLLQKYPEISSRLLNAWEKSLNFYLSNEDEALEIMASRIGMSANEVKESLTGIQLLTMQQQKNLSNNTKVAKVLKNVASISLTPEEHAGIPNLLDVVYVHKN